MLGKRLRELRVARGLTQAELAAPKYTHSYISTIEAGKRHPSRKAMDHFAAKLGVDPDDLEAGRRPELGPALELRVQEAVVALSAGELESAEAALRGIVADADQAGLPRIQAKAEEAYGMLLERQEQPETALEHFQRAEEILADEPPTARADAVAGKARCFHSLGDIRYEIHLLESLLREIEGENLADPSALVRVHAGLAFAYVEAGLYEKAATSATELERLQPIVTDPLRVAQMHMNAARVYLVQGHVRQAEQSLLRAQDAYRGLQLKTEVGYAHLALGYVYNRQKRLPRARRELRAALAIFEETGDTKDLTRALNELARVERLSGRPHQARALLERSIELLGDGDAPILGWAHRELGLVFSWDSPAAAEKHLRAAIEIYERSDQPVDLAVTYGWLGDVLKGTGQSEAGCEAYRTGLMALERNL